MRMGEVEDRPHPLHVDAPAQHEQREKPQRDREIAHAERETALHGDGRKDHEDPLEEDGDETEERDEEQRTMSLRRSAGLPRACSGDM